MTPQQQARLGEIAVWVGTAQQLLQQARSASATNDMRGVLPRGTRTAIADALQSTTEAADGLTPERCAAAAASIEAWAKAVQAVQP